MLGICIRKMFFLCVGLMGAVLPVMAQGRMGPGSRQAARPCGRTCPVQSVSLQPLADSEIGKLMHLREEEKLARDVYQTLYSIGSDPAFLRISQSEQRHMDALKALLDRYGLQDPAAALNPGEFSDDGLQSLYHDLVAAGSQSPMQALRVGASIEDLDLGDLEGALASTDNADLKIVYENLRQGSQNHMRAFAGRLESLGESYVPQYISEEDLAAILSSSNASRGISSGRGMGRRQGRGGSGPCMRMQNP